MNKLGELKRLFQSNNWEDKLKSSDELSEIGSIEALNFLKDKLISTDSWTRNAAVLGLMETKKQEFFEPILNRITELGFKEDIGTLVFALEKFDCGKHLIDICNLHLNGNAEVKMSTSTILSEQFFSLTSKELKSVKKLLSKHDLSIDDLQIKYDIY